MASCGSKQKESVSDLQNQVTDSLAVEMQESTYDGVEFLKQFYTDVVLNPKGMWQYEEFYAGHLTPKARKKLEEAYDDEYPNATKLGWQVFKAVEANDEEENSEQLTGLDDRIAPLKDGWYEVITMLWGEGYAFNIRLIQQDEEFYIDDVKFISTTNYE